MKNPKWKCAYPNSHKVKFGGKFLTQWDGYNLTLEQSTGGTISADRLKGYQEQSANLSYTANQDYYFNGWESTGAPVVDNKVEFTQDTTAKANFFNTSPSRYYSNSTAIKMNGTYSTSGLYYVAGGDLFLDGPKNRSLTPKFLSTYSGQIGQKNYFVLKYDYARDMNGGNYYWVNTAYDYNSYGDATLMRAYRMPISSVVQTFRPTVLQGVGDLDDETLQYYNDLGKTFTPMYSTDTTKATATNITSKGDIVPSSFIFSAREMPLLDYGKHYNHGRNGTFSQKISGYWLGTYLINTTASGKWDYSGYCFEPNTLEDKTWKTVKYVFDMNTFAYSSYIGEECVYKQTNTLTWTSGNGNKTSPSKLYAVHNLDPQMYAYWHSDWNGTSSRNINQGYLSARNISYTYFDTCEQANIWAKNN